VHVWRKYTKLWRFEHGIPPIHFAKLIGRGRRRAAVDFLCLSKREFRSLEEMDVTNGCELFGLRCNVPLTEVRTAHGVFWVCKNCGGHALAVELLHRTFTAESINRLWL